MSLGIGAGRLFNAREPYLSIGAKFRTRGRFAFVAEAHSNWVRLRSDIITAEWQQYKRTRIIANSSDQAWHRTGAIRLGFELR